MTILPSHLPKRQKPAVQSTKAQVILLACPFSIFSLPFQISMLFSLPLGFWTHVSFHSAVSSCPFSVVHYYHHSIETGLSWGTSGLTMMGFNATFQFLSFLLFWYGRLTTVVFINNSILSWVILIPSTYGLWFFPHLCNKSFYWAPLLVGLLISGTRPFLPLILSSSIISPFLWMTLIIGYILLTSENAIYRLISSAECVQLMPSHFFSYTRDQFTFHPVA